MKSIIHQEQLLQLISMSHIAIGIWKYHVWENLTVFFKFWHSEKMSRLIFRQGSQVYVLLLLFLSFFHGPATLLKLGLHWRCFSLNSPKPLQQLLHTTPVGACSLFSVFGIKRDFRDIVSISYIQSKYWNIWLKWFTLN